MPTIEPNGKPNQVHVKKTTREIWEDRVMFVIRWGVVAFVGWVGKDGVSQIKQGYDTLAENTASIRSLTEQMKDNRDTMKIVRDETIENRRAISDVDKRVRDHDAWAKEQKALLEHRQDELDYQLRRRR